MSLKRVTIYLLILVFFPYWGFTAVVNSHDNKSIQSLYKVIKIIDGDTPIIDFNNNNIVDDDEKCRLNGINAFDKAKKQREEQAKLFNITEDEVLNLYNLGKDFAEKELLNKKVQVIYSGKKKRDNYGRHLISIVYDDNKDYAEEILKTGLAFVYYNSNIASKLIGFEDKDKILFNTGKIFTSEPEIENCEYVILNKRTNKYHKENCPYGEKAAYKERIKLSEAREFEAARCCFDNEEIKKIYAPPPLREPRVKRHLQPISIDHSKMKEGDIKLFFIDPTKFSKPQYGVFNETTETIIWLINNAKEEINFAIYGFSAQDEIQEALQNAIKRGVRVQGIVDVDVYGKNHYGDETYNFMRTIPGIKTDYEEDVKTKQIQLERENEKRKYNPQKGFDIRSDIMHNKFFIVDNTFVWTGSTNITETCLTYNANNSVLIKSKKIAEVYNKEFHQMYSEGKYHNSKSILNGKENIELNTNTKASVYFSPTDKAITTRLVPIIDNAKDYVYIPIFYLTNKAMINSLLEANNRGVNVRILLDANAASNQYSKHHQLRQAGISVKTENWGGKMHMKSCVIDDKITVIASMNWTKAGEDNNDENVIIIENINTAKVFKAEFMRLWNTVPDKWLNADPKAESPDSIGSCFDGIDNNHNGLFDMQEPACRNYFIHGKKDTYLQ